MPIEKYMRVAQELETLLLPNTALTHKGNGDVCAAEKPGFPVRAPGNKRAGFPDAQVGSVASGKDAPNLAYLKDRADSQRACLAGFIQALRDEYGADIADMCVRDFALESESSLSARTVTEVVAFADRERRGVEARRVAPAKENIIAQNNWTLARLLTGGARHVAAVAGEDKNAALDIKTRWISRYARLSCRAMPEFSQALLTEKQLGSVRDAAQSLYQQLTEQTGVSPDALSAVFNTPLHYEGRGGLDRALREAVVIQAAKHWCDPGDPRSIAVLMAKAAAEKQGHAPISAKVLQQVAADAVSGVRAVYRDGADQADDGQTISAACEQMKTRLSEALRETFDLHCAALAAINTAPDLSPPQKEMLRGLGTTQRLDGREREAYTALAVSLKSEVTTVLAALPAGNFSTAIDALVALNDQCSGKHPARGVAGLAPLAAGGGMGDASRDLTHFLEFSIAGMTRAEAQAALSDITGKHGHLLAQGLLQSAKLKNTSAPILALGGLVETLARQSGMGENEASKVASLLFTNSLSEESFPPSLRSAVFTVRGTLDREGRAYVATHLNEPLSKQELETTTIGAGREICSGFLADVRRELNLTLPDGSMMIDKTSWHHLTGNQKTARIAAGYERLITLCGSETKALAWTRLLYQRMSAPFLTMMLEDVAHFPLRLPDGSHIMANGLGEKSQTIRFVLLEGGALGVEYRSKYLHPAHGTGMDNDGLILLDRESSYSSVGFDASIDQDERLVLTSEVHYEACLSRSGVKKYDAEPHPRDFKLSIPDACLQDIQRIAKGGPGERLIPALEALHALRSNPSVSGLQKFEDSYIDKNSIRAVTLVMPGALKQIKPIQPDLKNGFAPVGVFLASHPDDASLVAAKGAFDAMQLDDSLASARELYDKWLTPASAGVAPVVLLDAAVLAGVNAALEAAEAAEEAIVSVVDTLIDDVLTQLKVDVFPKLLAEAMTE